MNPPSPIFILATDLFKDRAERLAQKLNLTCLTEIDLTQHPDAFFLTPTSEGLCLSQGKQSYRIDFLKGEMAYRSKKSRGQSETLLKAIGPYHTLLDGTAGLGRDAFILASQGRSVLMLEQSTILVALLQDALDRAREEPNMDVIVSRMDLRCENSMTYMKQHATTSTTEVVYLDPMFPSPSKSALPQKPLQLLRSLIVDKPEDELLLETALQFAKKRVVIKRPRLSPYIRNRKPTFSLIGKSCRFDVYCLNR